MIFIGNWLIWQPKWPLWLQVIEGHAGKKLSLSRPGWTNEGLFLWPLFVQATGVKVRFLYSHNIPIIIFALDKKEKKRKRKTPSPLLSFVKTCHVLHRVPFSYHKLASMCSYCIMINSDSWVTACMIWSLLCLHWNYTLNSCIFCCFYVSQLTSNLCCKVSITHIKYPNFW